MRMARGSEIIIAGILFFVCVLSQRGESRAIQVDTNAIIQECEALLDSFETMENPAIKDKMSTPVAFYGEGRLKIQFHDMDDYPPFLRQDRSWIQSGWEGNEGLLRIGMSANIGSNLTLLTQIGFQNTFPGNNINDTAGDGNSGSNPGFVPAQGRHDKINDPAYIHDDLKAEISLRTTPASFSLTLGGLQWIEMSPLTVWKYQRRMFAWDYLPYEIEESILNYYDINMVKGERTGRAAWNKKPFNGIGLESIELPHAFYCNFFYGLYERYDSGEREFVDYSNELAYTADSPPSDVKNRGIGDSYHHILQLRLGKKELFNGLNVGLNYVGYDVQNTLITSRVFWNVFFGFDKIPQDGIAFYKEPKIASLEIKGAIGNHLELQTDIAFSLVDTTFIRYDSAQTHEWTKTTKPSPALYCHLKNTHGVPMAIDVAYVSSGFYSPNSFAAPTDAFFPFGSNLIGAGKFIARGEGSPYAQNMAGAVLDISPNIKRGHLKFKYGQHFQIQSCRDLIFFPYRLNGQDFFSLLHSSYNRWGIDLLDQSLAPATYQKRLGDESNKRIYRYDKTVMGPDAGGLRQDYLGTYEGFVPYENSDQAAGNIKESTSLFTRSVNVPQHRKFTFNLESDAAYDMSGIIGYSKPFYLSVYGAINGISTKATPIAFSQKNQLLWSLFLRFEPAIALTDKLYILGIAGFENWKSDKTWMYSDAIKSVVFCPMDFRDFAYGAGFDWEIASRVGLHTRLKWMRHVDVSYPGNNWETPIVSTEIKLWF